MLDSSQILQIWDKPVISYGMSYYILQTWDKSETNLRQFWDNSDIHYKTCKMCIYLSCVSDWNLIVSGCMRFVSALFQMCLCLFQIWISIFGLQCCCACPTTFDSANCCSILARVPQCGGPHNHGQATWWGQRAAQLPGAAHCRPLQFAIQCARWWAWLANQLHHTRASAAVTPWGRVGLGGEWRPHVGLRTDLGMEYCSPQPHPTSHNIVDIVRVMCFHHPRSIV